MAAPSKLEIYSSAVSLYNRKFHSDLKGLKDLQEQALDILVAGKDCICSIPTGYGKSLIYELLPFIDHSCLVIIIAPLNAIIKQQTQKLGDMAMCLSSESDLENIKNGKISYILSHPEEILGNKNLYDVLSCINKRNIFLAIDEAHCILEWGDEFRPQYKNIAHLRAIFKCKILALSATVTESGQKQIMKNLLMSNCEVVCASPAKDNIELIVKKRPSPNTKGNTASTPYDFIFHEVLTDLKSQLNLFPITVIYCTSMQWIGYGYEMARRIMLDDFYAGEKTPQNARVVMFHSSMEKGSGQLRDMILESLQKPEKDCCIRLIISSVALGMGADLKHVKRVIHAGPPPTLETYVQEIGRSGRASASAQAILFYNSCDLAMKHIRKEMKDYCRDEKCKRELINEYFGFKGAQKLSICCNTCQPEFGLEWDLENLSLAKTQ